MFQAFSQRNAVRSQRAGKNNEEERGGGGGGRELSPLTLTPPLAIFLAHVS